MDDKLGMLDKRVATIERDTGVKDLRAENESLRKQLSLQTEGLDELESYSRSDNLVIKIIWLPENTFAERASGLPNTDSEQPLAHSHRAVEDSLINFCRTSLDIDISHSDISVAHRIKSFSRHRTIHYCALHKQTCT